jgi:hypothetical protein
MTPACLLDDTRASTRVPAFSELKRDPEPLLDLQLHVARRADRLAANIDAPRGDRARWLRAEQEVFELAENAFGRASTLVFGADGE